jgi:copper homeostasis protein (lipoprotein)
MKNFLTSGILLLFSVILFSCNPSSKTGKNQPLAAADNTHNSRNSLDWYGTYHGVLPCADCEGIHTMILLNKDLSYNLKTKYADKSDSVFESSGSFTWNDQGNTITLSEAKKSGQPANYFVGENTLTQLDMSGNKITGDLASKYVLKKSGQSIVEKYWKLTELNGKPLGTDRTFNKEPHVIFKMSDNRMIGNGGCNSFTGSYELKDPARITISKVVATQMACMNNMDIESQLFKVLETADNYNLVGDTLVFSKASMAPLARFQVVYLK